MLDKQGVYDLLGQKQITYEAVEHAPVYTIEEMDDLGIPHMDLVAKNLFLRDGNKRHYYLVTMPGHKKLDLKKLRDRIGSRHLSFASEKELGEIMHLEKGHVTPFGMLNDEECRIMGVFDREMQGRKIGVHPMENTATVFMAFDDLVQLVKEHGNEILFCDMDGM